MQTNDDKITLPRDLFDKLNLSADEEVEVEVADRSRDSFVVRAVSPDKRPDYAAHWFLVPTALASVIFFIAMLIARPHVIPMTGNLSIATGLLVIGTSSALITFVTAYIGKRKALYRTMHQNVYWRTFPTILASLAMILLLSISAIFWFVGQIFHGLAFDSFTSALIFALFTAILNYFVIFIVDTFNIEMLVNFLILTIIAGVVASMATNGNKFWWQRNFSLLGTSASKSAWQFNLTLVISAALFLALVDYIFVSLTDKYGRNWRHIILRVLLSGSALSIAAVGLIPNQGWGHFWHDQVAMLIVYFMGAAILGIRF
ncbi:MAG: AbrB/MazE/SpoVT family DNA-binding domain-containing protein, partial [Streptococcaceae bacterium]|nr:AbrB/MazE/SpoVT family DNA-binding domain-containing protein [Streptococcaceae bacterium]